MDLFFGGAEKPEWRKVLSENGVKTVSMSFTGLASKIKNTQSWSIADHFADDVSVLLDSGAYSFNKASSEKTEDEAMDLASKYMAFVAANIEAIDLVTEFDCDMLGPDWLTAMREDFWDEIPEDKFMPVWHETTGRDNLNYLSQKYKNVGILAPEITETLLPILRDMKDRHGVRIYGISMSKLHIMEWPVWDGTTSISWLSPSKYGETHVFQPNNELKWYPKDKKEQARSRWSSWFEQNGFDAQAIKDDTRTEVIRLTVWSWVQYVSHLNTRAAWGTTPTADVFDPFASGGSLNTPNTEPAEQNSESHLPALTNPSPESRHDALVPVASPRAERKLLPVISVTEVQGELGGAEGGSESVVGAVSQNLMRCNNCYIKDVCPEAKPDAECAYNIPVEVTSKRQMRAVQDTLISIQAQRVFMMRMVEQVKGGYADQNLSAEIDRLSRMIKTKAEIEKNGFKITIEQNGEGDQGVLSKLLGKDVGDQATELDTPYSAEQVMELYDAEVVEGE